MTTVHQIEEAVKKLSESEYRAFAEWFAENDAKRWDEQFERDVKAGRLDKLADAAVRDFKDGKSRAL
jgi:hypothetical protein